MKKEEKRKYKILINLIVFGVVSSLSPVVNLFVENDIVDVIVTIFASLGGGLLCSAIVSLLVEKFNEIRDLKQLEKERDFITRWAKLNLRILIERERNYLFKFLNESNKKISITLQTAIEDLVVLAEEIEKDIVNKITQNIVIDVNYLKNKDKKEKYLFSYSLPYYKGLRNSLVYLSDNAMLFYTQRIFDDKVIDKLNEVICTTEQIICECENKNYELLLEMKQIFFNDLKELCDIFKINLKSEIRVLKLDNNNA